MAREISYRVALVVALMRQEIAAPRNSCAKK
jgi:hypothetical protein